jgi:hypothetical protein
MVKNDSKKGGRMIVVGSIKSPTVASKVLVSLLAGTAIVYLLAALGELPQANKEQTAMLESILFLGSVIGYSVVARWIILNLSHGRYDKLPYLLAIGGSISLIALYLASRTLPLPNIGLQSDVGTLDIISKVLQGIVIVLSAYVILKVRILEHTRRATHA